MALDGLPLKLEMLQRNRMSREAFEIISEDDQLLKSWETASQGTFFKLDFFHLLRKTLLYVLSFPPPPPHPSASSPVLDTKRKNLIKRVSSYFTTFSSVLKNNLDLRKPLIDVIINPWNNHFFNFEDLFCEKISIKDKQVQHYLAVEPEEIVLARVHFLCNQGRNVEAMILAKCFFLFHCRVTKSLSNNDTVDYKQKAQSMFLATNYKKGLAALDWYLHFLKGYRSLPAIVHEINQLTCHEGVLSIQRLRRSRKNQEFIIAILHILLMRELVQPSKYCCTKKIFSLWCIMHKENGSSPLEIGQAVRKLLAPHAPTSAHFYLFADALWAQFGSRLTTLYVELYVRGLTTDLNHYEVAKDSDRHEDAAYIESHIALMFSKLSTLFSDFHDGAARECMFSAFSLKPTKERLYILQSLTHSILSSENETKHNCTLPVNSLQECKCDVRCDGSCKNTKDFSLEHPLLKKGISNVPFMLVRDLVTVLEGVRCFGFQYNIFDWHNNATDLGDYLKDFILTKSWESDTEYASEGSNKSDTEDDSFMYETTINESLTNGSPYVPARINDKSLNLSVKRKSNERELFSLEIGANIEVENGNNLNKRVKIDEIKAKQGVEHIFNESVPPVQPFSTSMGMEDAIENVIRLSLDKDKQNSELLLNNNNFLNTPLSRSNDGVENFSLSSVNAQMPENHVYPYSLTSFGKRKNLSSDFKGSGSLVKSTISKYSINVVSKSLSNQVLTSPVSRESVISPNIKHHKKLITMQEQALKQLGQNKLFSLKSHPVPTYCHTKSNMSPTIDSNKKVPVYQPRPANVDPNSAYDLSRNTHNPTVQSSQYIANKTTTVQILQKSGISRTSNFAATQYLPNASISAPCSVASPLNLIQTNETLAVQRSTFPSTSQCVSRSDPRFHYSDQSSVNNTVVRRVAESVSCFQDNQLVHCDRSSVIQHTMQHVKENPAREVNDVDMPNQLTVSVNSNAVEQLRYASKEDIANLQPFTVNVTDKMVPNSPVSGNLVISRKPQQQPETSSSLQPVSSELIPVSSSSSNNIVVQGLLCPTSVIVTPWEAQHKSHGELSYKKNAHVLNTTSIDKRIYKNRPPYPKPILFKQEPKAIGPVMPVDRSSQGLKQEPNAIGSVIPVDRSSQGLKQEAKAVGTAVSADRNSQGLKGILSSSHISCSMLPSLNKNQPNASHVWSAVNKSSTQGIPQSTSSQSCSQPWYSEPYPKPYVSNNNLAPKSSGNLSAVEQSVSSQIRTFKPIKQSSSRKLLTTYSKQIHQSKSSLQNILTVPATVSYSLNNPAPSSTSSSVLSNVSSSSTNLAAHSLLKKTIMHKDFTSVSFSTLQLNTTERTLPMQCNLVSNPTKPSNQYVSQYSPSLIQEKSPVVFSTANTDANLQYSHTSKNFSDSCCSPSEINPCQNCSLSPTRVDLAQISSQKNEDKNAEQSLQSNNKMVSKNLPSTPICDSELSGDASDVAGAMLSNVKENFLICQYCSQSFPTSELEMHVLNSHSKEEINEKHDNFNASLSLKISSENASASFKSLPDIVPEQDSLLRREPVQDNLPQTITNPVVDQSIAEDVKNLDPVAFNACMDLIDNDKDLKRIVQGIDPFNQMENDYIPFMPSTDSTDNFLNSDMCDEIPKTDAGAPLQDLGVPNKDNEFNNYNMDCNPPQLEDIKLTAERSQGVFEFTEKDYEASKPAQKLAHSKAQNSCTENMNSSKTSNELTFSALAEMIKVSMTEGCNEELEPAEPCAKDVEEHISHSIIAPENAELALWNCSYCQKKLRSNISLQRHIRRVHPGVLTADDFKSNLSDAGSPGESSESNVQSANEGLNIPFLDDISANSPDIESSCSLTPVTDSNANQNMTFPATQFGPLPKGRIKGFIKSPTSQCGFCGKMLTSNYMKKHILKKHSEIPVKSENSSSELNDDVNKSSSSQVDLSNFTAVSTLPDQDIDSSTCLSVSDALKRTTSYTIADASNVSGERDKLSENMNIKFNFHDLELSNEGKVDSKEPLNVENKDLLSPIEPPSSPPIVKTEQEASIKVNVTYSKRSGFILQRHACSFCSKAYSAVSSLNKHLRTVHQIIDIPRNPRKNKQLNKLNETQSGIQNVEKSSPLCTDNSHIVIASKSEPLNISDNNVKSLELSCTSKFTKPHAITYQQKKSADKHKRQSSLNLNGNLLRSVLQSNFKSKQLEMQDSKGTKETVFSQENRRKPDIDSHTGMSENQQNLCSVQSSAAECLDVDAENKLKTESSDVQCNDKFSASVPSGILSQSQKLNNANSQVPGAIKQTVPSVSSNVNACLNNVLLQTDKNLPTHYSNLVNSPCSINSQNLSVQSSEISPVSEIISNVSKCHFGGASNKDISEKELYEDNSLKLLIPKNQQESTNVLDRKDNIEQSFVTQFETEEQESNVLVESEYINTSEESNLSINKVSEDLTVTNPEDSEAETAGSKSELTSYEEQSMPLSSENESNKKCRLCHQNLSSVDSLSKHLKDVHDIPVLKKHISELYSVKNSKYSPESVKLSPPKLRLRTNESDSESVSDLESPHINSKVTDSAELCTAENRLVLDNSAILPVFSECDANESIKNSIDLASNLESAVQSGNTECKTRPEHPTSLFSISNNISQIKPASLTSARRRLSLPASMKILDENKTFVSDSNFDSQQNPVSETSSCKYEFRQPAFTDLVKNVNENKSLVSNEYVHVVSSNSDLQCTDSENLKSDSLTKFQVALRCETDNHIELKLDKTKITVKSIDLSSQNTECPEKEIDVAVEHSSGENESLGSVTDSTELSKTSCDTASQNCAIQWDAIAVKSGFLLSDSVQNSPVSKHPPAQPSTRKRIQRNFKLLEKIETYKKQKRMKKRVRAKYFACHKKFKSKKAFKPLILTLKEATEISEFLKTHKQPMVKLIRLKEETYSNTILNRESSPVGNEYCLKEAIVRLERIPYKRLKKLLIINPKVIVSDLMSDTSQFDSLSMQNHESQSINFPNDFCLGSRTVDLSQSKLSTVHLNPPIERIDFSDTVDISSDTASVDANRNVSIEEKCHVQTDECCSVPLVKKCFVVLKRLSI